MAHEQTTCCSPGCVRSASGFTTLPICSTHGMRFYGEVQSMLREPPREVASLLARPPKVKARPGFGVEVGVVYYARCDGLIKIGFSTNVRERMKNLGAVLVYSEPGTLRDEKAAHHRFGLYWERGEYFREEGDLADFLAEHARQES